MQDDPSLANPLAGAMRDVFDAFMRQMMFCLPGKVVAFNPEDQTAQIQCGLQRRDAKGVAITIPIIDAVPVQFPGDNDFYLWHEVKPGCEGLIHFSQRSIDEWRDRGGPVLPADRRMLAPQDAFFVPGFRSRKNSVPNFRNEGAGISNKDGTTYLWAKPGEVEVVAETAAKVTAPTIVLTGHVQVIGPLTLAGPLIMAPGAGGGGASIQGDVSMIGNLDVTGTMTNNGKSVGSGLRVSGVTPGSGNSGFPV